jgi:hypothetical protein
VGISEQQCGCIITGRVVDAVHDRTVALLDNPVLSTPGRLRPIQVPLDLLGRIGPARLRLRVLFGVTDDMPTLSVGLLGLVWIFGVEVSSDPSVGYSGVRTVLSLGR